jgi:hypothetical protein
MFLIILSRAFAGLGEACRQVAVQGPAQRLHLERMRAQLLAALQERVSCMMPY